MKNVSRFFCSLCLVFPVAAAVISGCSTPSEIKRQHYAELSNTRVFEYEFPVVWQGVENAFSGYRITDRDPDEVTPHEMEKLVERSLTTDWVYSQSRDKYQEYRINGVPKRKFLQTRLLYHVVAIRVVGGTQVKVQVTEEIEKLRPNGTSAGFVSSEHPDSSRANDFLEKINLAILSGHN